VIPLPGPAACTALLSVSGFAATRVFFTGFLPLRTSRRRDLLARAALAAETVVCYENPHRIEALLADIAAVFGPGAEVLIGREMTKIHEEYPLASVAAFQAALPVKKGEFTVAVRVPPDWNVSFKFEGPAADMVKRRRKESRHEYRKG
jgi:16S rRNA (cytidine1402-2'-O)-methyltransferase